MTTPTPPTACRFLASLWPAPATFAALAPDGTRLGGDAGLAARAAAVLAAAPKDVLVVRDGDLVVARRAPSGPAMAAQAPGAPLPALLEADLSRLATSEAE